MVGECITLATLSNLEMFFTATGKAFPIAMIVIDEHGVIRLVNPEAERLFGYRDGELIGQLIEILVPPRLRQQHSNHRRMYFGDPRARAMGADRDLFGLRKDGSEIAVEIGLSPIETRQGRYALAAIVDMSERRQREEESRQLAAIVNNSVDAIIGATPDGFITNWNEGAARLFGYSAAEIIGRPIAILVPDDHTDEFPDVVTRLRRGELVDHFHTARLRKDGETIHVSVTISPIHDATGHLRKTSIISRDISERKRMEQELQRSNQLLEERVAARTAELTRRNEDLVQFAYVASHDLQEPLRKIVSCCQTIAEDYSDKLDDDGREWIKFAVDSATRMRRLVSDLLDLARIDTHGKAAAPTDAQRACDQALEHLGVSIQENRAQIICRPLPTVLADHTQLVQLFQNLVGNGVKYRGPDDPVIEVGADLDGSQWRFYVRDNGIGIAPEFYEHVFQVFQRLHHKEDYPGTGIGLAICKKIVERCGGKIWVESVPGRGSTFWFTFPVLVSSRESMTHGDINSALPVGASD